MDKPGRIASVRRSARLAVDEREQEERHDDGGSGNHDFA